MADIWSRHITDSLQLLDIIDPWRSEPADDVLRGYDLGSGAGLPGAVLALVTADRQDLPVFEMTLVEANSRKAAFLRTVSRETGVRIKVEANRIEDVAKTLPAPDFITARALAPLPKLADLAKPWLQAGATAFFHKGGEYAREMAEWPDATNHDVVEKVSEIDPDSRVLRIDRRDVRRGT
jgi:16S rRNA (guanine527-N7)-methyltransferase